LAQGAGQVEIWEKGGRPDPGRRAWPQGRGGVVHARRAPWAAAAGYRNMGRRGAAAAALATATAGPIAHLPRGVRANTGDAFAMSAELAEREVARVKHCFARGPGSFLDMWTQTAPAELPRCLNETLGCPNSSRSVASASQCVAPEQYVAQLQLQLRLSVLCSPEVDICCCARSLANAAPLVGAAAAGSQSTTQPAALALAGAARVKLAQCMRLAWQEVHVGVLLWDTDDELVTFHYQRPGARRLRQWRPRRRRLRAFDRVALPPLPAPAPALIGGGRGRRKGRSRRTTSAMQHAELAVRVDTYRLSPSSPTSLLHGLLSRDGSGVSACLGFWVGVRSVEWQTEAGVPDLTSTSVAFVEAFRFEGYPWNEQPLSLATGSTSPSDTTLLASSTTSTTIVASLATSASDSSLRFGPAPSASSDSRSMTTALTVIIVAVVIIAVIAISGGFAYVWLQGCRSTIAVRAEAGTSQRAGEPQAGREAWSPSPGVGPPPYVNSSDRIAHNGSCHAAASAAQLSQARGVGAAAASAGWLPPHAWGEPSSGRPPQSLPARKPATAASSWKPPPCFEAALDTSEPFLSSKLHVARELDLSVRSESSEERRRRFKDLCLTFHPDKNGDSEESKSVFQFLQAQKEQFIDLEVSHGFAG